MPGEQIVCAIRSGQTDVKCSEDRHPVTELTKLDALLADLDGVVTETAKLHRAAWKRMFDEYLEERSAKLGEPYRPFTKEDYARHVDGKPRYDGVTGFLQSRRISLPFGHLDDSPDKETVCGLGNRKNGYFQESLGSKPVRTYSNAIDFIRRLKSRGLKTAVVSSSRNCSAILQAAGVAHLFDTQVDGNVARKARLKGKPAPDTYLEAACRLGVSPERAVVIEDAISGVQAGRAGGFGLIIGVDRAGQAEALKENGADIVISDLGELRISARDHRLTTRVPSALERLDELKDRIANKRAAVFLDYDGTLTPIVDRPDLARISESMRRALRALAEVCPVAIISGRARADVESLVGLDELIYAGSHGFDIRGPKGLKLSPEEALAFVPHIHAAASELEGRLSGIPGTLIEDKNFSLAVHYRLVAENDFAAVKQAVDEVAARYPKLRITGGKKIFELRPDMEWDKGKAILWILEALNLTESTVVPFYLGDDITDRDAFKALCGKGISIFITEEQQPTLADYRLANTAEVELLLRSLTTLLQERRP